MFTLTIVKIEPCTWVPEELVKLLDVNIHYMFRKTYMHLVNYFQNCAEARYMAEMVFNGASTQGN